MDRTAQVRDYVLTNFYVAAPSALTNEASLLDQGIVDSTGVLEVVAFLEKTFAFRVADEEMLPENLDSISRIVAFASRKTSATRSK